MLFRNRILLFFVVMLFSVLSDAQNASVNVRKTQYNLEKDVAIQGYDPVAYFDLQKSVKGNKTYVCSYEGVVYYFSTAKNLERFKKNPPAFEPQYGGWCAYAMGSAGKKVEVDPETFKILNGKLYLFYHTYFNNTLKSWNEKESELKPKADMNWKNFIH